ncbi:hypothetical protein Hanom_Chr11g01026021 [Helianthus anomalus]
MEHTTRLERIRHLNLEMGLNMRAYDENQLRRHQDYHLGVPYVETPPYMDYSSEPPYLSHPDRVKQRTAAETSGGVARESLFHNTW